MNDAYLRPDLNRRSTSYKNTALTRLGYAGKLFNGSGEGLILLARGDSNSHDLFNREASCR